MSGLEAVAALSLACNIMQIIGVGRETVRLARNVYQDGEIDPALNENARILRNISQTIRTTTTTAGNSGTAATTAASSISGANTPTARDKQLLGLVDRCQGAARDLDEEVKFLNGVPGGKAKLLEVFKVAAKTKWREKRLDKLVCRLKETETHLQTGLLARIFERTERTGIDLSTLDADLQLFIQEYRKGHTDTTNLVSVESIQTRNHVTAEAMRREKAIKEHITQHAEQSEKSLENIQVVLRGASQHHQDTQLQARREKLLRSLKFDRVNERRNHVEFSHRGTCTWVLKDGSDAAGSQVYLEIYDDDDDDAEAGSLSVGSHWFLPSSGPSNDWDSFSDWLRSTETVYWINGKPGSGKSTLIKYILHSDRTSKFLQLWRSEPVLISHFFWRPGSEMQQSIKGLLCSLMYQLLSHDTASLDRVLETVSGIAFKDADTDWSIEELQASLHKVICQFPQPIAMFLDGLDEVLPKDGTIRLLKVIDQLKESGEMAGIKLCLGSRREPLLQARLGVYPQLRLENLNFTDLHRYAMENITIPLDYHVDVSGCDGLWHKGKPCDQSNKPSRAVVKRWLVFKLTHKAEGVFLWLCLTVKTVARAIGQGETMEDLKHRIERLPGDLTQLYAEMWARNNTDDTDRLRDRAAAYFRLALASIDTPHFDIASWLTPFTMAIATKPEIADLCFDIEKDKKGLAASLLEACMATKRDIEARCFGLLDCPHFGKSEREKNCVFLPWHGDEFDKLVPYVSPHTATFMFIHRTARDFLVDTETGRALLGSDDGNAYMRALLKILKGRMACSTVFRILTRRYTRVGDSYKEANSLFIVLFNIVDLRYQTYKKDRAWLMSQIEDLLPLCERLFNHGYIVGTEIYESPTGMERYFQFRLRADVKRQQEFFSNSAFLLAEYRATLSEMPWEFLFNVAKTRNLDQKTKSDLMYYMLWTVRTEDKEVGMTERLLETGCSPTAKHSYQQPLEHLRAWTMFESALKCYLERKWNNSHSRSALAHRRMDFLKLLLKNSLNFEEELHFVISFSRGFLQIVGWREPLRRQEEHTCLVIGYPVTAILGARIRRCGLESHADWAVLARSLGIPKETIGQGHLISVVKARGYGPIIEAAEIYPLGSKEEPDEDLVHLIRLSELYIDNREFVQTLDFSEMQKRLDHGFERMRSRGMHVPLSERRRWLTERLNATPPEGWFEKPGRAAER